MARVLINVRGIEHRTMNKYFSIVFAGAKARATYGARTLMDLVQYPFGVYVLYCVYSAITAHGTATVGGFTLRELLTYTAAVWFLKVCVSEARVAKNVQRAIVRGDTGALLARPVDMGAYFILFALGLSVWTAASILGILILLVPVTKIIPFLALSVLAWLATVTLQSTVGWLSVWVEDIRPLRAFVTYVVFYMLGGALLPIDLLPDPLRKIAETLPIKYVRQGPGLYVAGKIGFLDALVPLSLWIPVFIGVYIIVERAALRRMDLHGG